MIETSYETETNVTSYGSGYVLNNTKYCTTLGGEIKTWGTNSKTSVKISSLPILSNNMYWRSCWWYESGNIWREYYFSVDGIEVSTECEYVTSQK
jgi:hypothetical protein